MIRSYVGLVAAALLVSVVACDKKEDPTQPSKELTPSPKTPAEGASSETRSADLKPATTSTAKLAEPKDVMKTADADMKKVLEKLQSLGGKPLATLSPEEARKQPTPADAVKKILEEEKKSTAPLEMAKVENKKIAGGPGAKGQIDVRIYTPKTDVKGPLPVIAYWHGGGFVIADLDVYDATPRALAKATNAIVVSSDYRHAPENKFPAAHDDAIAAYQWITKNAASFNGDPKRIAVAGESAGGNLAANVAIAARDKNMTMPLHELLVYPVAQTSMSTESYQTWDFAQPLNKANMVWFVDKYTKSPEDTKDTRINLVGANLEKLPKTTIVLAEIDPLRSDGVMLGEKLKAAGVDVDVKTYEGVTHEFFGMGAVVSDAKDAVDYAGGRLKSAFEK